MRNIFFVLFFLALFLLPSIAAAEIPKLPDFCDVDIAEDYLQQQLDNTINLLKDKLAKTQAEANDANLDPGIKESAMQQVPRLQTDLAYYQNLPDRRLAVEGFRLCTDAVSGKNGINAVYSIEAGRKCNPEYSDQEILFSAPLKPGQTESSFYYERGTEAASQQIQLQFDEWMTLYNSQKEFQHPFRDFKYLKTYGSAPAQDPFAEIARWYAGEEKYRHVESLEPLRGNSAELFAMYPQSAEAERDALVECLNDSSIPTAPGPDFTRCVAKKIKNFCWLHDFLVAYEEGVNRAMASLGYHLTAGRAKYRAAWEGTETPTLEPAEEEKPKPESQIPNCILVSGNGNPGALDILYLPSGFSNMSKFFAYAEASSRALFGYAPFIDESERINIWALNTTGNIACRPLEPRMFSCDMGKIASQRVKCPNDQVVVAVNSKEWRGAGFKGGDITMVSTWSKMPFSVVIHELGHSFGGLDDEYVYGGNASSGYAVGPNCDRNINCTKLGTSTCFQECSYDDLYRAEEQGMMRTLGPPFGEFDEKLLKAKLLRYSK